MKTSIKKILSILGLSLLLNFPIFAQTTPSTNTTATIQLTWTASISIPSLGNINYNVYEGTNAGQYFTNYSAGTNLNLTISNLVAGSTYYFAATATDTNAVLTSTYSSPLSFTSIAPPLPPTTVNIIVIKW
jgi:hypothetical protein